MSQHKLSRSNPRRGGVLVLALVAVSSVAVMAACMLQMSMASMSRQRAAIESKQAFYLAEAGLTEAYLGLSIGKTGNVGRPDRPAVFGGGLFWVEATQQAPRRVRLESTAMFAGSRTVLAMLAERGEVSVATLGVFSSRSMIVQAGSVVDAYDSRVGYVAPAEGIPAVIGRIGSNEDIEARGSPSAATLLHADVTPGQAGSAVIGSDVTHLGKIEARTSELPLPPVALPFEPESRSLAHSSTVPLILQPGDTGLRSLAVGGSSEVIVVGPCTLVVGELLVQPGGTLTFDSTGGPIEVHVRDRLDLAEGSFVSTTAGNTSDLVLQVQGRDQPVVLGARGAFNGVVYSPEARMQLGAEFEVFGAAIADELLLAPGARLHFDLYLDEVALQSTLPKLLSWTIVDTSPVQGAQLACDPFELLGLDAELLPSPCEAHADQDLGLAYVDMGGRKQTYNGLESAFDWSLVAKVEALTRDGADVLIGVDKDPVVEPPADPDVATAALNAIQSVPALASSDLRKALQDLSPLAADELLAAIKREPALRANDLAKVLEVNPDLGSRELGAVLDLVDGLNSTELRQLLIANSPLPPDILARVLAGTDDEISSQDRDRILAAN